MFQPFMVPMRVLMLLGGGLLAVFGSEAIELGGAGPLAVVAAAFVSCYFWQTQGWEVDDVSTFTYLIHFCLNTHDVLKRVDQNFLVHFAYLEKGNEILFLYMCVLSSYFVPLCLLMNFNYFIYNLEKFMKIITHLLRFKTHSC